MRITEDITLDLVEDGEDKIATVVHSFFDPSTGKKVGRYETVNRCEDAYLADYGLLQVPIPTLVSPKQSPWDSWVTILNCEDGIERSVANVSYSKAWRIIKRTTTWHGRLLNRLLVGV